MAKNNNKPPRVEAPVVEKPAKGEKNPARVDVVQVGDLDKLKQSYVKNGGLDPNHRVDVLNGLKTYFKDDPNAAANTGISQETVDLINSITAVGYVAALGDEVMMGSSSWAAKMRMTQIESINKLEDITGISINIKALPAPAADGTVQVEKKDIKISAEAKKKLEQERKLNEEAEKKDYLADHTKIVNDEQLKEALGFQLVNSKISSPADRLVTTAQFYRAYLEARAEKSDNAEAELAKIHEYSLAELLQDISTMVPPSFTAEGFGKLLCNRVATTKSVVPAFELFKRCFKNRKTGKYSFSDEDIAAMVRVLVVWKASAKIASLGKDIKALSKDAKANAKAIEKANADIAEEQSLISMVTNPPYDVADQFIAAYNNDDHELHKTAIEIYKSIVETYYKGIEVPELEFETMLLNVQQRAGIDLNLFNEDVLKRDEFSEKNLVEFKTEEKPVGEEESKNA